MAETKKGFTCLVSDTPNAEAPNIALHGLFGFGFAAVLPSFWRLFGSFNEDRGHEVFTLGR